MELWQLRTFVTLAKTLHFTRAAEELNLSQPAVSHHIKILEKECGKPLFERGKEGISLTPAGEVMLRHAVRIFEKTEEMKSEVGHSRDDTASSISIGIIGRALESPFAYVYHEFKSQFPNLTPKIHNVPNSEAVLDGVRSRNFDIGLVAFDPECDKLEAIPYSKFNLLFIVGPGHPLEGATVINAKTAEKYRWALFEPGDRLRSYVDKSFEELDINPKSIFSTNDGAVIRDFVASGQFVSLLPSWGIFGEISQGKVLNIKAPELETEHDIYLIRHRDNQSIAVDHFADFLLKLDLPGLTLKKHENKKA